MPFTRLEQLWERTLRPGSAAADSDSWNKEMEALYHFGIGMEETLRYLYREKPSLEDFKSWIISRSQAHAITSAEENILTTEDLAFFEENGYVVVKNAVTRANCEAAQAAIREFLGMNLQDKNTWYMPHSELRGLMLTFTDHESLVRNRQSARIKKAYEQLYQSTALYMRIDKVSFNPPETQHFQFAGDGLHWDVSLKQPIPLGLQGLLYLTDCTATDGAFYCVPGFHRTLGSWLEQLPPGENPRGLAPVALQPVAVTGQAGDFVIWHQALPHCATPNRGLYPRMVQYLTYWPVDYVEQKEWM